MLNNLWFIHTVVYNVHTKENEELLCMRIWAHLQDVLSSKTCRVCITCYQCCKKDKHTHVLMYV